MTLSPELSSQLTPQQIALVNRKKKFTRPSIILPGTNQEKQISEDFEAYLILSSRADRASLGLTITTLLNSNDFLGRTTRDAPAGIILNLLADQVTDVGSKTAAAKSLDAYANSLTSTLSSGPFAAVGEVVQIREGMSNFLSLRLITQLKDDFNYQKAMATYYAKKEGTDVALGTSAAAEFNSFTSIISVLFLYDLEK
jgi:hypothetical protein